MCTKKSGSVPTMVLNTSALEPVLAQLAKANRKSKSVPLDPKVLKRPTSPGAESRR